MKYGRYQAGSQVVVTPGNQVQLCLHNTVANKPTQRVEEDKDYSQKKDLWNKEKMNRFDDDDFNTVHQNCHFLN